MPVAGQDNRLHAEMSLGGGEEGGWGLGRDNCEGPLPDLASPIHPQSAGQAFSTQQLALLQVTMI